MNKGIKRDKKEKTKLEGIIFTRACCCIGIVIFHYFSGSKRKFMYLLINANSSYGFLFVTSFFCISGVVLYYNYPKMQSIKRFYYKRWKSILVPYYICFLYFFLRTVFIYYHKLFYKGDWPKIFLTIIGMDGYFCYRTKTYFLVGAWFLGAIIIIYVLYPLLLFIITKSNIILNNILICFFYYLMYNKNNYFIIQKNRNIITCITSFYFGIESFRFKRYYLESKKTFIFSAILFIFLCTIKIKINYFILISQIQGFCLFIILYQIGRYIMKTKFKIIFNEISNISYNIFLFHSGIISDIRRFQDPNELYLHIILLSVTILLTIICSKIHSMVVYSIYKSYIFMKLDSFFI